MVSELLSPLTVPETPTLTGHPTDSSRILLSMLELVREGEQVDREDPDSLDSVVARSVLRRLLSALQLRDVPALLHSRRVALLSVGIAQQLSWECRHLRVLEVAALLHDLGKVGVPDHILHKPGRLSSNETALMAVNNNICVDVLQACRVDKEVVQIVSDSQALYDVSEEATAVETEVHLGARILAVADAYDSLTHDQPYRPHLSHEEAMQILHEDTGTKFDGNVVNALARWIDLEGLPRLLEESEDPATAGCVWDEEMAREASVLCHIFSQLYILESLYDGFYLLDSSHRFALWNRGMNGLLGRTALQMLGTPWNSRVIRISDPGGKPLFDHEAHVDQVLSTGEPACRTLKVQHRKGHWIDIELQTLPLKDHRGVVRGVAEIFRDISREQQAVVQLRDQKGVANRDALTGVADRDQFDRRLEQLSREFDSAHPERFSVIFLDLDSFQSVNDTHGFNEGDRVLIGVARLLQAELYSGELVGRCRGQMFGVICPSTDYDSAMRKAERLRTALSEACFGDEARVRISASAGVAQFEEGDTPERLLERVDAALGQAKEAGRNKTCGLRLQDVACEQTQEKVEQVETRTRSLFTGHFTTTMMPEMLVYKVGGFVSETDARVVKVSEERVQLQIGRRSFFGGWGDRPNRQPIDIILEFSEAPQVSEKSPTKRVLVTVSIRPLGRPASPEVFQTRGKQVLELLRCHFAAD